MLLHTASSFAPLRIGNFRNLWVATMASHMGNLIQAVGAGWMMATLTDSHNMVALVQGATTLPMLVFSVTAGALADNFDRRFIMVTAQVHMLVCSIALTACAVMGLLTPWLLLGFTFLIGCGTALNNPSFHASMGDLVERDDLPAAVSLNNLGLNAMRSIGPAIGGVVVALVGVSAAFLLNALSYLPLIVAVLLWKPVVAARTLPRERLVSAIAVGATYISWSPKVMVVIGRGLVLGFGGVVILALLPSVARDFVRGGALSYGTMLGCFGAGAIGGAVLNAPLRAQFKNETVIRIACIGIAAGCVALGLSRDTLLSHLALLPAGACWVMGISLLNTCIQMSTPRWVVGRAIGIYQTGVFGGMAAGSWAWGMVADAFGPDISLYAAGGTLLVCAAIGRLFPVPEFAGAGLEQSEDMREPPLGPGLRSRNEPIRVMTEYRITQEDLPAFLKLMAERRKIRTRDGAKQWVLLCDAEMPDLWIESYRVSSWDDYIRHLKRRTTIDRENTVQLLLLHRGEAAPRIRRLIECGTVLHWDDMPMGNAR